MAADLDVIAPNYRAAVEAWPGAPGLARHYEAVKSDYRDGGHALVETVKSFLESVCVTILNDHGEEPLGGTPTTTRLLTSALQVLGVHSSHGASKLDKVLSAYNRLADALNDCRNEVGRVAHGKDGFLDCLGDSHRRTYLLTGDALLSLLLGAMRGTDPNLHHTRLPYESFPSLHRRIDESVSIAADVDSPDDAQIFVLRYYTSGASDPIELRVEPSRLLFALDREAYVEVLASSTVRSLLDSASEGGSASRVADRPVAPLTHGAIGAVLVGEFRGEHAAVTSQLRDFLRQQGLGEPGEGGASEPRLADSLMATMVPYMGVDWRLRPDLRAALRVGARRVLSKFDIPREEATTLSEGLVEWLAGHIHDGGDALSGKSSG